MPKIKLTKKGKPLADAYGVEVYKQVGPGGKYQAYDAVGGKLVAEAEGISGLAHKLGAAQQDTADGMSKLNQAMKELKEQFKLSPGEQVMFMGDQHMAAKKPEKHGKKLSPPTPLSDDEAYAAYLDNKKQYAAMQAAYLAEKYSGPFHGDPSLQELMGVSTGHIPPKKAPGKSPEKIKQEQELEKQKLQQIADSVQSPEPKAPGLNYSALEAKLSVANAMSNTHYTYSTSGYSPGHATWMHDGWVQDQYGNVYQDPSMYPYKTPQPPPWSPGVSQHSVYQPAADASLTSCIFHAATPADNFKLCWNPKAQPLKNWPHPEHGTWVWCTSCNKSGIQPDPGFALEFAPEGSHVNEKGEVVFHVGKEKAA